MNFKLPNGKEIFCMRPDVHGASKSIEEFYNLYNPLIGGKTMTALDIGAGCGDSSVVIAGCLGPNSKIICFEPGREVIPILLENMKDNLNLIDYRIHTVAASNEDKSIGFISNEFNGGVMFPEFIPLRGKEQPEYEVQGVHIGRYLDKSHTEQELNDIKFIKIDCEGYDYVVLDGLTDIINKNKPIIVVEWWEQQEIGNKLFDMIKKLNYSAYNTKGEIVDSSCTLLRYTYDLILKPNE